MECLRFSVDCAYCERIGGVHEGETPRSVVWVSLCDRTLWHQCLCSDLECRRFVAPRHQLVGLPEQQSERDRQRVCALFGGCDLDYPAALAEDAFHLAPVDPTAFDYSGKSTHVWVSGKGTGKTKVLRELVSREAVGGRTVLAISSHQSMARFLTSEYGLECYLDLREAERSREAIARSSRLVISEESLHMRMQSNATPPDVLVLDEIETLLRHFVSETMEERREQAYCDLEYLVASARTVLVADADFGERGWWFLSRLRTGIVVHYNPPLPKSDVEFHLVADKKQFEALVRLRAQQQAGAVAKAEWRPLAVVTNSLNEAEYLQSIIRAEDPNGPLLLVSSRTRSDSDVRRFLEKPRVEAARYKYLLYTPTIGPGIDIATVETHFHLIMAYATPLSSCAADFLQQVGRIRASHVRHIPVFVARSESALEVDVDTLYGLVVAHDEKLVTDYGVDGASRAQWDSGLQRAVYVPLNESYARLWALNIAEKHRSRNNFLGELRGLLWQSRVPFREWRLDEDDSEAELEQLMAANVREKKAKRVEDVEHRRRCFREARVLTEASRLQFQQRRERGEELVAEDEMALDKFFVMRFWGLAQRDIESVGGEELDFLCDEQNRDRQRAFERVLGDGDTSRVFHGVLGLFGIKSFDDRDSTYRKESVNVEDVADKLLASRNEIERAFEHEDFGRKFGTLGARRDLRSVNYVLDALLESCGLRLHRAEKSVRLGKKTAKVGVYSVDCGSVEAVLARTVRRLRVRLDSCIERLPEESALMRVEQIRGQLARCGRR